MLIVHDSWTKKSHAQIGSIVEVLRNNGEFYSILKSFESLTDKLQEYMHNSKIETDDRVQVLSIDQPYAKYTPSGT